MWYQQRQKNTNSKCCCPLAFSQAVIFVIAILMILCGIGGLICRFTIFDYEQNIFILDSKTEQYYNIFKLISLIAGISIIVIGVIGIIGAKSQSKCILFLYAIGTILLTLLFLAIGTLGLFIYKQYYIFSYPNINNVASCTTNSQLDQEAQFSFYAFSTFCSDKCPCNMSDTNFKKLNIEEQFFAANRSLQGYNKLQDCPYFMSNYPQNQTTLLNALILMEQTLSCTGICYDLGYHVFADVNSGDFGNIPTCNQAGWNVLEDLGPKIMLLGYIISALLIINLIQAFCICCHPHFGKISNRNGYSNYYQQI